MVVGGNIMAKKSEMWTVIPIGKHPESSGVPGPPGKDGKDGKDGKAYEAYHFDLSGTGNSQTIKVGNLYYKLDCIATNGNLRLSLSSVDVDILADIKRVGQYEGGIEYNTLDNRTFTPAFVSIDDTIYSNSLEMNIVRIRQQDPQTNQWSICDVRLFASAQSKRVDVFVDWIDKDIEY